MFLDSYSVEGEAPGGWLMMVLGSGHEVPQTLSPKPLWWLVSQSCFCSSLNSVNGFIHRILSGSIIGVTKGETLKPKLSEILGV